MTTSIHLQISAVRTSEPEFQNYFIIPYLLKKIKSFFKNIFRIDKSALICYNIMYEIMGQHP